MGEQLTTGFLEGFGENFSAAWNGHDPGAVVALCTDDVQWSDPALQGSPTTGKEAVREFAAFTFAVFPDFKVEEREGVYVSWTEPMALCPYRMTGNAAHGGSLDILGIDRWTFRDGLLCRYDTYYDHEEMVRQVSNGSASSSSTVSAATGLENR
jgi:hypothetical protein